MSDKNKTHTRQFVELGDAKSRMNQLFGEENLPLQLLDRRMISSEIDRNTKAFVTPLTSPIETLIQLMRELHETPSTRSTEENVASRPSRSSVHRSQKVSEATKTPRSALTTANTTNPIAPFQHL